jgi:hypothetical protein
MGVLAIALKVSLSDLTPAIYPVQFVFIILTLCVFKKLPT